MSRELKPKPSYSCEQRDPARPIYTIQKYDPDGEPMTDEAYKVNREVTPQQCDCYAGLSGKLCRHKQILDFFLAEPEKIGSVHQYCFDRQKWV